MPGIRKLALGLTAAGLLSLGIAAATGTASAAPALPAHPVAVAVHLGLPAGMTPAQAAASTRFTPAGGVTCNTPGALYTDQGSGQQYVHTEGTANYAYWELLSSGGSVTNFCLYSVGLGYYEIVQYGTSVCGSGYTTQGEIIVVQQGCYGGSSSSQNWYLRTSGELSSFQLEYDGYYMTWYGAGGSEVYIQPGPHNPSQDWEF